MYIFSPLREDASSFKCYEIVSCSSFLSLPDAEIMSSCSTLNPLISSLILQNKLLCWHLFEVVLEGNNFVPLSQAYGMGENVRFKDLYCCWNL